MRGCKGVGCRGVQTGECEPMNERISRRGLIKGTALTASAAALGGSAIPGRVAAAEDARPSPAGAAPLRLGLMTYTLAWKWDIGTIIKNCTEAQFEEVELRTTHAHGVEVGLSKAERADVRRRFEDSPLKAINLASAFSYHHPDADELRRNIEGTKEYILLARDLGALGIRVFPNALLTDQGIPAEKTIAQIGRSLREVGEFGHEHGVEVRVEVHGRGTTSIPVIRKIVDASQSDHVYVLWNCTGNDDDGDGFEANFNLVKSRIRHIHMHDLYSESYPYRRLFELLRAAGYKLLQRRNPRERRPGARDEILPGDVPGDAERDLIRGRRRSGHELHE